MSDIQSARSDGGVPPPEFTSDQIIFHCPKGHRLVVKLAHAGKRGRCDRKGCGATVVVPVPPVAMDQTEVAPEVDLEPVAAVAPPGSHVAAGSGTHAAEQDAGITGSVADERVPDGHGWGFVDPGGASDVAVPADGTLASIDTADGTSADDPAMSNPVARLVARLWRERDHGGIVELHLASGSVVMPEWYERRWSQGTHGLFASQAPDGTVTLTAVAWDAIQKVVVRQVPHVPDGMFD